jgi:hypothetical protein
MAYTSRVFAIFRWLMDELRGQDWPANVYTLEKPTVDVGDQDFLPSEEGAETVGIVQRVDDNAMIEWKRIGGGQRRDESFDIEVVIRSYVPDRSRGDVFDRLEELADVVQNCVYDAPTGEFTAPGEAVWSVNLGGVSRVTFKLLPSDEGWLGIASVFFAVRARI